jgi:nicotinamidase-related amidase
LIKPIHKRSFSCYSSEEFRQSLSGVECRNVLVTGIETHVCVYQTVRDLHRHGYQIQVAVDAVSSRTQANKNIALDRIRSEGITLTSTEMVLCEWLSGADHPKFREIMANIKR